MSSPELANLMGLPVTARTERAAAGVSVHLGENDCRTARLETAEPLTASCPVMASSTSRMLWGLTVLRMRSSSILIDVKAPAVSMIRMSGPSPGPRPHRAWRYPPGRPCPLVIDGDAQLCAQGLELVDSRGTVDVLGYQCRALFCARGLASLPQAVPCLALQTHHHDDRGWPRREGELGAGRPIRLVSSSLTILMNCWAGRLCNTSTEGAGLDLFDELLTNLKFTSVQAAPDLPGSPLYVFLRDLLPPWTVERYCSLSERESNTCHLVVRVVVQWLSCRGAQRTPLAAAPWAARQGVY